MIVGFVGLGNMGAALATNLVGAGHEVVVHDVAGPGRAPVGAVFIGEAREVAERTDVVVCSLPDGRVSTSVARALLSSADRRFGLLVDTSTTGPRAAQSIAELVGAHGIGFVDAPVSGGVAGARARTLAVMYSGSDDDCAQAEPVLAGLSDRRRRVGDQPGLAQALKLVNNFLAATALAATSEAVNFGVEAGLDMATMLEVLNTSSGHNTATDEKFPDQVLTGRYASGFSNSLMAKDVALYLDEVRSIGAPDAIGSAVGDLWRRFAEAEGGADFTRVYPFVRGETVRQEETHG